MRTAARTFAGGHKFAALPIVLIACAGGGVARAGTAGNIVVATQDIYRGDQASNGDPTATLGVHHETDSGLYLGGTITVALGGEAGTRLSSGSQYGGYSVRAGGTTFDIGVIHRTYRADYSDEYARDFTEVYAGVTRGKLTARVFLSPQYVPGRFSVYAEADLALFERRGWSLSSHAGLRLTRASGPPINTETTKFDYAIRAGKAFGRLSIGAALSGAATKYGAESPRLAATAQLAF